MAVLTVFVRVWLVSQGEETVNHFCAEVSRLNEVVECHLMAGECDFLLRVMSADLTFNCQFKTRHLTRIREIKIIKT
ncbi:TPA: Lrp/AsnC family transcriptional regulator [Kluyvera ascorbata]|nr:Lrp/AsnC family transcriptional regulator [Kluyvera ascorbata]